MVLFNFIHTNVIITDLRKLKKSKIIAEIGVSIIIFNNMYEYESYECVCF